MFPLPNLSKTLPSPAFFDGPEQQGLCGCGVLIMVDESTQFSFHWNGGSGSNSKAEAMALAGLLYFCLFLNLQHVSIYGDSKVMVDCTSGKIHISASHLNGWMGRIRYYWDSMDGSTIHHIRRNKNYMADSLSKAGLQETTGSCFLQVLCEGISYHIQEFNMLDF